MNKRQGEKYNEIVARIKEGIALGKFHPDSCLLANYVLNTLRIKAYCGNPDHDFLLSPKDFKSDKWTWCAECSGCCPRAAERKFHEACAKQGAVAVGPYISTHTTCAVKCKAGHIRMRHPSNVVAGFKRDWCYGKCADKNEEELRELFARIGFILLSSYTNCNTPLEVLCDKGHPIKPRANDMLNKGTRCLTCDGSTREQGLANLKRVLDLRGEELIDESEYVNNHTRVCIRCASENGHVYHGHPGNITSSDHGCPSCNESHLERAARLVLEKLGLRFEPEYHDPLAPSLAFDFRFWYREQEYRLELDGIQHFSNKSFYGRMEEQFRAEQARDRYKDGICLRQSIPLIRIPYTCLARLEEYLLQALEDTSSALIACDGEVYTGASIY
jgi:hypothetical protein